MDLLLPIPLVLSVLTMVYVFKRKPFPKEIRIGWFLLFLMVCVVAFVASVPLWLNEILMARCRDMTSCGVEFFLAGLLFWVSALAGSLIGFIIARSTMSNAKKAILILGTLLLYLPVILMLIYN